MDRGHKDRDRYKNRIYKGVGKLRWFMAGTTSCENRVLNKTTDRPTGWFMSLT